MARGVWLSLAARPGLAWVALAVVLAVGVAIGSQLPATAIDWQPRLAANQPWRAWTAAFVHLSPLHLGANMLGLALVAMLGWRARCGPAFALAWLMAWPLTQAWLAWQPALAHYGGLSGVLHAGVAVACCGLLHGGPMRQRVVGAALLIGLGAKLLWEAPWQAPLQHSPAWDFAIAPFAHATGAAAGLLCGILAWRWLLRQRRRVASAAPAALRRGPESATPNPVQE